METIVNYLKENRIDEIITIGSVIDGNGVGLFRTSGLKPIFYFGNSRLEQLGLQIIVRNENYSKGEKIINNIFTLLNSLDGYEPQQSPFFIGKDEKGRSEFSVNYIIKKEGV